WRTANFARAGRGRARGSSASCCWPWWPRWRSGCWTSAPTTRRWKASPAAGPRRPRCP
ncbi:MAG: hypothetical protein AVDCRST_MAG89-1751, partial [uncultured Gemmatimonadetes bacterium]